MLHLIYFTCVVKEFKLQVISIVIIIHVQINYLLAIAFKHYNI